MNQLTLDSAAGAALKAAGLDQVEGDAQFLRRMRVYAVAISLANGRVTSDDLRALAVQDGLAPRSSHSWGCVFRGQTLEGHWDGTESATVQSWANDSGVSAGGITCLTPFGPPTPPGTAASLARRSAGKCLPKEMLTGPTNVAKVARQFTLCGQAQQQVFRFLRKQEP